MEIIFFKMYFGKYYIRAALYTYTFAHKSEIHMTFKPAVSAGRLISLPEVYSVRELSGAQVGK